MRLSGILVGLFALAVAGCDTVPQEQAQVMGFALDDGTHTRVAIETVRWRHGSPPATPSRMYGADGQQPWGVLGFVWSIADRSIFPDLANEMGFELSPQADATINQAPLYFDGVTNLLVEGGEIAHETRALHLRIVTRYSDPDTRAEPAEIAEGDVRVPSAPRIAPMVSPVAANTSIKLSWDPMPGIDGILVLLQDLAFKGYSGTPPLPGSATSVDLPPLATGTWAIGVYAITGCKPPTTAPIDPWTCTALSGPAESYFIGLGQALTMITVQ